MVIRLKPKSYGPVHAVFAGGDITYALDDVSQTVPHPPAGSPVETMLAALAACMVRSAEMAAARQMPALVPFSVRVEAERSTDPPGRIASCRITFVGAPVKDARLAAEVIREAKAICTVSNSLNAEFSVGVEGI